MRFDELSRVAMQCQKWMKSICPVDTGNMRLNITAIQISSDVWKITIGGDPAPYAVYTNEKWISDKWNGARNPNEKWIDKGVAQFVTYLAEQLGGVVSSEGEKERWENKAYYDKLESARRELTE